MAFTSIASSSSSLSSSNNSGFTSTTPASPTFATEDARKPIALCDGYVAVPVWEIRRANQVYTPEERRRAQLLNFKWEIKGTTEKHSQRCPSIWVDNVTFLYKRGMEDVVLLLGRWKKDVEVYGHREMLEGLVVAGGGHYERCAAKPDITTYVSGYGNKGVKLEPGDMSLRAAADKEMTEEIGIDADKVMATESLGYMDEVFSDPRCHGLRFVYLRWVEQEPRASAELKNIIAAPLRILRDLADGTTAWTSPEGQKFGMILNHGQFLRLLVSHPQVVNFIANLKIHANATKPGAASMSVWS